MIILRAGSVVQCARALLDRRAGDPHVMGMGMADTSATSEAERAALIRAIAERADREAFMALFRFYAPRIKAQTLRFGLSADAAEDVVQDAMLSVWRHAGKFDAARGSASAWIFTIAVNARTDRFRREQRIPVSQDIDPDSPLLAVEPPDFFAPDAVRLAHCLEALPEEQRRIIHLSFYADIPHGEIARQVGVPLGTVKSRIRLAMSKLRQALRDEE